MRVDAFHYELDPARIAQRPTESREAARLMILGPDAALPEHRTVAALPDLLPAGALVVVNDTRVIPARLLGAKRDTGGQAEIFLVQELEPSRGFEAVWTALGRASKGVKEGAVIVVGILEAHVLSARSAEGELLVVGLRTTDGSAVGEAIRRVGRVPLPPYIRRPRARSPESVEDTEDTERYQTVFARVDGAVAAPTAGLHLTESILARVRARGCEIAAVTLHVGLGTFQPVTADDLDHHAMHEERYEIPPATAAAIDRAREREVPVVAIGTTVVRALESAASEGAGDGRVRAMAGRTRLLIQPGYRFRVADLLLTNLHLPRSTLLALVCAFGGTERVLSAYRTASDEGYRFFSYGDAMLVWPEGGARARRETR